MDCVVFGTDMAMDSAVYVRGIAYLGSPERDEPILPSITWAIHMTGIMHSSRSFSQSWWQTYESHGLHYVLV
jgi:hypothetical protein